MILLQAAAAVIFLPWLAECQQRFAIDDAEDPQFIGYFLDGPATERLTLSSGTTWSSSGTFAGGCSTSPCVLAVDCANNILTMGDNEKLTCIESYACETMTIYETYPFGKPSAKNYRCRLGWSAHTIYRAFAEETIVSAASSPATGTPNLSSESGPTDATDKGTRAKKTTAEPTETSSPGSEPQIKTESSKAWIAGAVAGPIVGAALLALVFWLGMRHQRKKKDISEVAPVVDKPQEAGVRELHGSAYSPRLSELPEQGSAREATGATAVSS